MNTRVNLASYSPFAEHWRRILGEGNVTYKTKKFLSANKIKSFTPKECEEVTQMCRLACKDPLLDFGGMFDTTSSDSWVFVSPVRFVLVDDWVGYVFLKKQLLPKEFEEKITQHLLSGVFPISSDETVDV